jgi:hypothetical protein
MISRLKRLLRDPVFWVVLLLTISGALFGYVFWGMQVSQYTGPEAQIAAQPLSSPDIISASAESDLVMLEGTLLNSNTQSSPLTQTDCAAWLVSFYGLKKNSKGSTYVHPMGNQVDGKDQLLVRIGTTEMTILKSDWEPESNFAPPTTKTFPRLPNWADKKRLLATKFNSYEMSEYTLKESEQVFLIGSVTVVEGVPRLIAHDALGYVVIFNGTQEEYLAIWDKAARAVLKLRIKFALLFGLPLGIFVWRWTLTKTAEETKLKKL